MTTQELAQKILEMIEHYDKEKGTLNIYTTADMNRVLRLVDSIQRLCQEEAKP
jgi:hypothetical protein